MFEWKLIRSERDRDSAIEAARNQTRRYAAGLLAGFEISRLRILVTISEKHVEEQGDVQDGGVAYRHVTSRSPSTPSRS